MQPELPSPAKLASLFSSCSCVAFFTRVCLDAWAQRARARERARERESERARERESERARERESERHIWLGERSSRRKKQRSRAADSCAQPPCNVQARVREDKEAKAETAREHPPLQHIVGPSPASPSHLSLKFRLSRELTHAPRALSLPSGSFSTFLSILLNFL